MFLRRCKQSTSYTAVFSFPGTLVVPEFPLKSKRSHTTSYVSLNSVAAEHIFEIAAKTVARSGSAAVLQKYEIKLSRTPAGIQLDLRSAADLSVASTQTTKDALIVQDQLEAAVMVVSGKELEALYLASMSARDAGQLTFSKINQVSINAPAPDAADYFIVDYTLKKPAIEHRGDVVVWHCDTMFGFVIDVAMQTSRKAARVC